MDHKTISVLCSLIICCILAGPKASWAWTEPIPSEHNMRTCLQPPAVIEEPFSLRSDSAMKPSEAYELCAKYIASPYDTSSHPTRMKAFAESPLYKNSPRSVISSLSGIWTGSFKLGPNASQAKTLLIHNGLAYLFDEKGKREKAVWALDDTAIYLTTNFRYLHAFPLTGLKSGHALHVTVRSLASPMEIQKEPVTTHQWHPVTFHPGRYELAAVYKTPQSAAHAATTGQAVKIAPVAIAQMTNVEKNALAAVFAYTSQPADSKSHIPVHLLVRYAGLTNTQAFSLREQRIGTPGKALFSQAFLGRAGASLFLAVDSLPVASFTLPVPKICHEPDFETFFQGYSEGSPYEQAACVQFPLYVHSQLADQPATVIEDLYDLVKRLSLTPKLAFSRQDLGSHNAYSLMQQGTTAQASLFRNNNKDSTLFFIWDETARTWMLAGIAVQQEGSGK